jgi:prolyl-tRNA synthetase
MASTGADKIGEGAQANPEPVAKNELLERSNVSEEAGANGELSKNAAKKAAKREKQAADKATKSKDKPIGATEAKKPTNKPAKKKIEGAALIGIDVAKEEDFSGWYQQVLTKGDMLDYYDVSGCYILKVCLRHGAYNPYPDIHSLRPTSYGSKFKNGSTSRSRRWA